MSDAQTLLRFVFPGPLDLKPHSPLRNGLLHGIGMLAWILRFPWKPGGVGKQITDMWPGLRIGNYGAVVSPADAGDDVTSVTGFVKIRSNEGCRCQVGLLKNGVLQLRLVEGRAIEFGAEEEGMAQVGFPELRLIEHGEAEIESPKVHAAEVQKGRAAVQPIPNPTARGQPALVVQDTAKQLRRHRTVVHQNLYTFVLSMTRTTMPSG